MIIVVDTGQSSAGVEGVVVAVYPTANAAYAAYPDTRYTFHTGPQNAAYLSDDHQWLDADKQPIAG